MDIPANQTTDHLRIRRNMDFMYQVGAQGLAFAARRSLGLVPGFPPGLAVNHSGGIALPVSGRLPRVDPCSIQNGYLLPV